MSKATDFYEPQSDDILHDWLTYKPHGDHKPGDELPEGGVCVRLGMGPEWSCGHEDA